MNHYEPDSHLHLFLVGKRTSNTFSIAATVNEETLVLERVKWSASQNLVTQSTLVNSCQKYGQYCKNIQTGGA